VTWIRKRVFMRDVIKNDPFIIGEEKTKALNKMSSTMPNKMGRKFVCFSSNKALQQREEKSRKFC